METVVANFDDVLTVQDSTLICRGRFALLHETIQNRGMSVRNFYSSLKSTVGMAFSYKTSPQPRCGGCGGRGVVLGVCAAGLGTMGWQRWPEWPTATVTTTVAKTDFQITRRYGRYERGFELCAQNAVQRCAILACAPDRSHNDSGLY